MTSPCLKSTPVNHVVSMIRVISTGVRRVAEKAQLRRTALMCGRKDHPSHHVMSPEMHDHQSEAGCRAQKMVITSELFLEPEEAEKERSSRTDIFSTSADCSSSVKRTRCFINRSTDINATCNAVQPCLASTQILVPGCCPSALSAKERLVAIVAGHAGPVKVPLHVVPGVANSRIGLSSTVGAKALRGPATSSSTSPASLAS